MASAPLQSQPQTAGLGQGCGSRWPEASVTPRGGLTQVKVRTHAHACTSMHTRRARTGTYTRTLPRPAERGAHCTAKLSLGGATASGSRGSPGSPSEPAVQSEAEGPAGGARRWAERPGPHSPRGAHSPLWGLAWEGPPLCVLAGGRGQQRERLPPKGALVTPLLARKQQQQPSQWCQVTSGVSHVDGTAGSPRPAPRPPALAPTRTGPWEGSAQGPSKPAKQLELDKPAPMGSGCPHPSLPQFPHLSMEPTGPPGGTAVN